jgi:glutathione S-transferase
LSDFVYLTNQAAGRGKTIPPGKQTVFDEHFTVADAYMFVIVRWNDRVGFDPGQFPLQEFPRPPVQAAMKAEGLLQ